MKRILALISQLLWIILLVLSVESLSAQTWVKQDTNTFNICVIPTSDGNIVLASDTDPPGPGVAFSTSILTKMDMAGNIIWRREWRDTTSIIYIVETSDSGFVAAVERDIDSANLQFCLARFDKNGNRLWLKKYSPADSLIYGQPFKVVQNADGGFTESGGLGNYYGPNAVEGKFMVRTDANGDSLWTWWARNLYADFPLGLTKSLDGGFALSGNYDFGRTYIDKIDSAGHLQWEKIYANGCETYRVTLIATPDSGYLWTGAIQDTPWMNIPLPGLMKVNANGDSMWTRVIDRSQEEITAAAPTDDGGYLLLMNKQDSVGKITVVKLDNNFDSIWRGSYPVTSTFIFTRDICGLPGGGFAAVGQPYDTANPTDARALMLKVGNINANYYPNVVKGHVYRDVNNNCVRDSGDIDLIGKLVQIHGAQSAYGVSNPLGAYSLIVDSGAYHLTYTTLDPFWKIDSCNISNLAVHFSSMFDTAVVDIPLTPLVICAMLDVQIGHVHLRRCTQANYYINYTNYGSATADSAYVEIELDPYISYVNSSIPVASHTGQLYRFNVGAVLPGRNGAFNITVSVSCASELGQTHCVTAHIYPDSTCFPVSPLWDRASMEVLYQCNPDSVVLEIHNKGTGNMSTPLNYYIVEDNVMFKVGQYQLPAGQSHIEKVPANGSTWTLIAEQSKHHPGFSAPLISVEACGRNNQNTFSKGFVPQFPLDDLDAFIDISCREDGASFDPNEKTVSPLGLTASGYISKDQVLQYQIDFQNTGNDTAFKVIVKDTLSPKLDITTFQLGTSSHPYSLTIVDTNILVFTFDTIMLPDSNINESASHGFVTFTISQRQGNHPNDMILNRAGIYFDFNSPVFTNTTINTIVDDYKQWLGVEEISSNANNLARVFPNPTKGDITIWLQGLTNNEEAVFKVFDLSGMVLSTYHLQGNGSHNITNLQLQQGMYLYEVTTTAKNKSIGKIMVYE